MRPIPRLHAVALCSLLAADPLAAQTLRGRLLDDETERPIGAAFVILLDSRDNPRDSVFTDSTGAFHFRTQGPGRYRIQARRMGYEGTITPVLKLKRNETLAVDFLIAATVTRLPRVTVTAESEERVQGLHVREFGTRYVSRDEIRPHVPGARTFGDLLRWQSIAGLRIEERKWGDLCVTVPRARGQCLDVYLDGSPMSGAFTLNPRTIDRMVLLNPQEATMLFGSHARRGVLLIYTRRGLPSKDEMRGTDPNFPTSGGRTQ